MSDTETTSEAMPRDDGLKHLLNRIQDEMVESSGLYVFRVTGSWAHEGREGIIDDIVVARNLIEAIQQAWLGEDPADLRTIEAEWLTPLECVKKASLDDSE